MKPLRLALLADGTSDRALLPVVRWRVRETRPELDLAEIAFAAGGPGSLLERMTRVIDRERPDVLLVHRDAEAVPLEQRRAEIPPLANRPLVRVVPVRMTEAWLILDEAAIRRAAGNPNGRTALELPRITRLEALPDPKAHMHDLLVRASELTGPRRRKRFLHKLPRAVHLVAEAVESFSPLETLPAFRAFERDLDEALEQVRPRGR